MIKCRAIFSLLAATLLCLAASAAADDSTSVFADPFGDGVARTETAPPFESSRRTRGARTQVRRYAAQADAATSELARRRPQWRPFRWMAQELSEILAGGRPAAGPSFASDGPAGRPTDALARHLSSSRIASQEASWFTPSYPPPDHLLSVVDEPAVAPPATGGGVPAATWHGLSLKTPSASKNVWLAYPVYLEKFAGAFLADEPIENQLKDGVGILAGLRTGWDYSEHWGVESRVAFARTQLGGSSLPTEAHENFVIWDAMWLYYPLASTVWRPFFLLGPGLTFVSFIDDHGTRLDQTFFHVPIGFGIKHRFGKKHAFRFDIVDNLLFTQLYPRHVDSQFSFVGGFEWRFGDPLPW